MTGSLFDELWILLEELDELGYPLRRLVELGDKPIEGLVRQAEVLVLLDHALGPRGDRLEYEGSDGRVLQVGRLTDECVLLRGHAHFETVASRRGGSGLAHESMVTHVRTLSGRQLSSRAPPHRPHGGAVGQADLAGHIEAMAKVEAPAVEASGFEVGRSAVPVTAVEDLPHQRRAETPGLPLRPGR